MTAEQRAQKSVEAAVKRFADGRYAVIVHAEDIWPASVSAAADAVKNSWEPEAQALLDRTMKKVGLEDAPGDYDCFGMEAVMWHIQEMAREMFRDQMRRRGIEAAEAEKYVRDMVVGKWNG
jgi:hypothetical protein